MDESFKNAIINACGSSYTHGVKDMELAVRKWIRVADPALTNNHKQALWDILDECNQGENYLPDYVKKYFSEDK